ncbi:MAG: hypothetical protein EAZ73_18795 [Oscillatoriales cyanobacterium]|nr:MAG: hypothetical protein EAZ83_17500 [Oscillatoriales cyanobacterium]TAE95065.1 MAG: hypothetical protein EAZ79_20470 [Oscillatoriales cyanobacterium]TAF18181.1 MAG: hypothetical protein EAZ73_18795 [Oscillatoriales cyanobacterium]TAF37453.1 MAG: hypothetical protein EAZ69_07250 [Oscillatoriales cyanobacterium]
MKQLFFQEMSKMCRFSARERSFPQVRAIATVAAHNACVPRGEGIHIAFQALIGGMTGHRPNRA